MSHLTTRSALAVLLLVVLPPTASAGETETTYGVGLVAGFDSNPLLVTGDGPSGTLAQLRLDGGVTRYFGPQSATAFFLDGRVATRRDESRTAGAGVDGATLRAGVALAPRFAGRRLVVTTGGRLSAYRGTFIDRATGQAYTASVDPPTDPTTTIPIPDRLDSDHSGAFLNLRWKQGQRLTWSVDTSWDRTDYVEDYAANTDLDPLDYRAFTVRPAASIVIADVATLTLGLSLTDLAYDDRPALDPSGLEVPGTRRSYRYAQYQLGLRVTPTGGWRLNLGLGTGGRDDTYAGYYDSAHRSGSLALQREFGRKIRLGFFASLRDVAYDHATVSGDPTDEIRSSEEWRYTGRFVRTLSERLRWYVEGGTERTDSQDPVFTYERDWVFTGFRFGR